MEACSRVTALYKACQRTTPAATAEAATALGTAMDAAPVPTPAAAQQLRSTESCLTHKYEDRSHLQEWRPLEISVPCFAATFWGIDPSPSTDGEVEQTYLDAE